MPTYSTYTCSIATKKNATVDIHTLSKYLQSASYTGSTGVPSRAVAIASSPYFDRIQYFILSQSEVESLRTNENIFFIEYNIFEQYSIISAKSGSQAYLDKTWYTRVTHDPGSVGSGSGFITARLTSSLIDKSFYPDTTKIFGNKHPMSSSWAGITGKPVMILEDESFQHTYNYPGSSAAARVTGQPDNFGDVLWRRRGIAPTGSHHGLWIHTDKEILTKYSGSGAPGNPFRHGGALQLKYISRWKNGFNSQNIPSSMSATVDVSNPSYFSEADPVGLQMPTNRTASAQDDNPGLPAAQKTNNKWILEKGIASLDSQKPFTPSEFKNLDYSYHLTGKGVDFINLEPYHYRCADYYDSRGNPRFNFINWSTECGLDNIPFGEPGNMNNAANQYLQPWSFTPQNDNFYFNNTIQQWDNSSGWDHGNLGMSMAAGLTSWGKDVQMYNYPYFMQRSFGYYARPAIPPVCDLLSRWHVSKSIDPGTGFRRPTVINTSMGIKWENLHFYGRTGSHGSGHFYYPESKQGHLKGIRINYLNKDYCFISASFGNISADENGNYLTSSYDQWPIDPNYMNNDVMTFINQNYVDGQGAFADYQVNRAPITPWNNPSPWTKVVNGVSCSLNISVNGHQAVSNFYYYTGGNAGLVDAINKISHAPVDLASDYGFGVLTPTDQYRNMYGGLHRQVGISGSALWNLWGIQGMFHITASYSGNQLYLSSSQHTFGEIKVFTGSAAQFLGLEAHPTYQEDFTYDDHRNQYIDFIPEMPYGGGHAYTFDNAVTASSGLEDIVYRGVSQYAPAMSRLHSTCKHREIWPQARHGFAKYKDHDHFGIDNGWNMPGPPLPSITNVKAFGYKVREGIQYAPGLIADTTIVDTGVDVNWFALRRLSRWHTYYKTHELAYSLAAERGVIWITSAGNENNLMAQSGSATEEPFSPQGRIANGTAAPGETYNTLGDCYFKFKKHTDGYFYDYEHGNDQFFSSIINFNPDNIYHHNKTQPSNGSAIVVGGINPEGNTHAPAVYPWTNDSTYDWQANFRVANIPLGVYNLQDKDKYSNKAMIPAFLPHMSYNLGPGVDGYMVSDNVRLGGWPMNNDTDYQYQFYWAASHSIFHDVERKYGIDYETGNARLSASSPGDHAYIEAGAYNKPWYGSVSSIAGGGTSTASPNLAGLVTLYLQANPGANINDCRKWLKFHGKRIFRTDGDDNSDPIYLSRYSSSIDITQNPQLQDPRYVNINDGRYGGKVRMCQSNFGLLPHMPYSHGYKVRK
jgi:hypothetical protein